MNNYNTRNCCWKNNNNSMSTINDDCDDDMTMVEEQSDCSNICTMPKNNCNCGFDMDTESVFPENPMLAQSYVPMQRMKKVFTPEVGLKMGTIFPELVSPYMPGQSIREIEYLKNSNEIGEGCNR
jgi:hypothetical protein